MGSMGTGICCDTPAKTTVTDLKVLTLNFYGKRTDKNIIKLLATL